MLMRNLANLVEVSSTRPIALDAWTEAAKELKQMSNREGSGIMKHRVVGRLVLAPLVFMTLVLIGCAAQPKLTREEQLSVASRSYEGVTKEQIIMAAERVLELADGDDFKITHTEDGLFASRGWTVYIVLGALIPVAPGEGREIER